MRKLVFVSLLSLLTLPVLAQQVKQRFNAGASLSFNVAQIDGDKYFGYRKLGLEGGLRGIVQLTTKQYLSAGILFSQRGGKPSDRERSAANLNYVDIRLNYAEMPFLYHIHTGQRTTKEEGKKNKAYFYPFTFFTGTSLGRIVSTDIETNGRNVEDYPILELNSVVQDFSSLDVTWIIGGILNFDNHWGLNFQHTLSAIPLYTPAEGDERFVRLLGYHFSIGIIYVL